MLSAFLASASVALNCFSIASVVSSRTSKLRGVVDELRTCGSVGLFCGNDGGSVAAQPASSPATEITRTEWPTSLLFIVVADARDVARDSARLANSRLERRSGSRRQPLRVVSYWPRVEGDSPRVGVDWLLVVFVLLRIWAVRL